MIALALYLIAGILVVAIPCYVTARYLEWRAWDNDRRIERMRDRRERRWSAADDEYHEQVTALLKAVR